MTRASEIANWVNGLSADDPGFQATKPTIERSIFDWIACGCAGRGEPVAQSVAGVAEGQGVATFSGKPASPRVAALINGATSHALDYDDTHFAHVGHCSVTILPAVFAVAEDTNASWDDLLLAAYAGLEASVHLGVWLGRGHYAAGFHQTATAGVFGAAIASAWLMGTDIAQSLALATTRAAGLRVHFGTMAKPLNAGFAAATGVEVAELARLGATADLGGMEAMQAAYHGDGTWIDFDEDPLFPQNTYKFHACCHGLHAALEAYQDLPKDAAVTLWTNPRWLSVCAKPDPMTGLESKFSYAHVLALAAAGYDTGRLDSYTDALAQDDTLSAWRGQVTVLADEALTDTQVRITAGGVDAFHDLADEVPADTLDSKLRAKGKALLGPVADDLWSQVQEGDMTTFMASVSC